MENALHITAIWLHILGIALFVGPQFFLAFAWVPASRRITDMPTRIAAMRTITKRFAYIGGTGLGLILIAGTYLIATWRDFYSMPSDVEFNSVWYGVIFSTKMTVLLVMLIIVGVHTFKVGPKLIDTLEAEALGKNVTAADVRRARRNSMILSISGLVLVLVIMAMGTMLTTTSFSLQNT